MDVRRLAVVTAIVVFGTVSAADSADRVGDQTLIDAT
jgi:hypothetical protein